VPALIEIADQDISPSSQTAAIQSLGYVGPPAKQAVPSLLLLATNAHWELRSAAVRALGRIHVEPNRVLPVLTNALHDTNVSVQLYAVGALRDFGPNAKLAVPALFEYLSHAASPYRLEIDSALKAIDPQAAAKAGIK
jgi:HEAT repeat protein